MTILFLGPAESPVLAYLRTQPERVEQTSEPLTERFVDVVLPDFVVSHGYRHLVRSPFLERFDGKAVNLHISYLPWNRGADPNVWSFVEDTPKGVTIHYIDAGVDTGDIIAQREVEFGAAETLASSYARLQEELLALFVAEWPSIRKGICDRRPQDGRGTSHRIADRARIEHLLRDGWATPVHRLRTSPT